MIDATSLNLVIIERPPFETAFIYTWGSVWIPGKEPWKS